MKNSSIYLIIIGIVLVALAITNPPLEKQKELLVKKMISESEKVKNELSEKKPDNALDQMANELGQQFLQPEFISNLVNNSLSRDNYIFFSLPRMTVMNQTKIIGVGIFGSVYWLDKEKVNQGISDENPESTLIPKNLVKCEVTKIKEDNGRIAIQETCIYENLKVESRTYEDAIDFASSQLFLKGTNNKYYEIKNKDLFNDNNFELSKIIYDKLLVEFNKVKNKHKNVNDCMNSDLTIGASSDFEKMEIRFDENSFFFHQFVGMEAGYCMNTCWVKAEIPFSIIKKYLNLDALKYSNYQDKSSQVNTINKTENNQPRPEEQVLLSDESSLIAYLSGKTFHGTNIGIEINPSSIDIDGVNRYFNISFSVISPTLGRVRGESLSNPDGVINITVNTRTGCIENDGGSFCQ